MGVDHDWLLDPEAETLEEFVRDGDAFQAAARHAGDDTFEPAVFRDLAIDLSLLWPRE